MKSFRKNVLRLALRNKSAVFGAVLIIGIGIFVFVSMIDTLKNLDGQITAYYKDNGMADIFAEVEGISSTELERLTEIPGIKAAGGCMARDVRILSEGQKSIVSVHLMSYDPEEDINKITLSGQIKTEDDIFLGIQMSEHYTYPEGTPLRLLWNGESLSFEYRGTCRAPNYIYSIPHGGAMVPDGEVYDIAVIEKGRMERLLGRGDSVNELGFLLEDGYTFEDVRHQLTDRLTPYGLTSLVERADQTSVDMVDAEMVGLILTGTILPLLFMAISVFMLYVVLKKMIDRDQTLIGTMKAFGMTNRELISAYLIEGAVIGAAGALLGSLTAGAFGRIHFDLYIEFFSLPDSVYHDYLYTRIIGMAISLVTAVLAVFLGVREVLHIAPATAMRQPEPKLGRLVKLPPWLKDHSSIQTRISLRSMGRHPFRGFLVILSVVFAFSLTSSLYCFIPMFDELLHDQFQEIQVYDLQLTLDRFVTPGAARDAATKLRGVKTAEGICQTSVMLQHDNLTDYTILYGLHQNSELYRIRDNDRGILQPPKGELILNRRTADALHVKKGDYIELRGTGLTNRAVRIRVADVMTEFLGTACYTDLESFRQIFHTASIVNTIVLQVRENALEEVRKELTDTSRVSWIVDTNKIIGAYRGMIDATVYMVDMFGLLSVVAGAILIYNISMINLKERFTELGTLEVLGMSHREISSMLLMEKMIYFALGILLGFPGSWGINRLLEILVISDTFDIRLHIAPVTYCKAFALCLLMILSAWYAEQRLMRRIDLTEMLKARE